MALTTQRNEASILELSIALSDNARTRPLIDGHVTPQGIRLLPSIVHPSELVWRQLHFGDFDISEMSLSTLFISVAQGNTDWVGLPIYAAVRRFPQTDIFVRRDAGIEKPTDLRGKRIGLPEYQQTSSMWARGILQHEFGVHPSEIDWYIERLLDKSHGGATGFEPPPGVRLNQIPSETNVGEMLVSGKIDGTLVYLSDRNLVDRSQIDLATHPDVRRLFPNGRSEGHRYVKKTGIYPMNRAVVIRRSVLERHSWVALNIYSAFVAAKAYMQAQMRTMLQPYLDLDLIDDGVFDQDPMDYGLKVARPVLEMAAQFVHEQGLTKRRVAIEELFAPCTLDL
jgi:4,5-dihydroxyphthalate decarboxylase